MENPLEQELVIDFKTECVRSRPVPRREPDWENRSGQPNRACAPGTSEELKAQVIQVLKNCVARLEGDLPQKAWEPRSKSWPYTRMGLALMKTIELVDILADRYLKEAKDEAET
jgi:hypothetical protein